MCKVKTGALIVNKGDVQNMIVGIILRQQNKYKKEEILEMSKKYFQGSALEMDNNTFMEIIEENLEIFSRNEKIFCENGNYIPRSLI